MSEQSGGSVAVRVVIADRDPRVRALIKFNLAVREDAIVIGEAAEGIEAAALVEYGRPDLLIIDEALPGFECVDLRSSPETEVIRLGNPEHDDVIDKADALKRMSDFAVSILGHTGDSERRRYPR